MEAFQLAITIAVAALGLVNMLVAIILGYILQEIRGHRALHDVKDYLPRSEFHEFSEVQRTLRHKMVEDIIELRAKTGLYKVNP